MECAFCGGELKKTTVTFSYEEDDTYIFVEHVPAEVCPQCGEKLYTPEVTEALLKIAGEPIKPAKFIQVPVYDFTQKTVDTPYV